MKIKFSKNSKIAILGYGIEGKALVDFLWKRGYKHLEIRDIKPNIKINHPVQKSCGKDYLKTLDRFDLIFRSPGIPYSKKEIQEAKKQGAIITSATKLFFDLCPAKIIGITGTKGKGTTSSLIYSILKKAGKKVFLAGNIGVSPLALLDKKLKKTDYVVLELSSFQLQDIQKSPQIAVLLMVTQDHLEAHKSLEEYLEAKKNIFRFQKKKDVLVLNNMYPVNQKAEKKAKSEMYLINTKKTIKKGIFVHDNTFYFNDGKEKKELFSSSIIKIPGRHNYENVAAAAMVALKLKISIKKIIAAISVFRGLPHRLEKIFEKNTISFIDDSISTTPETTIAAINSFVSPIVLILGGSEKGADYSALGEKIATSENIKKIIFLGELAAKKMEKSILEFSEKSAIKHKFLYASGMEETIEKAINIAEKGDTVLLSPGAASFDLFENYKKRGDSFKNAIINQLTDKLTKRRKYGIF